MTTELTKVPEIYTGIIPCSSSCNGSTKTEILSQRATKAKIINNQSFFVIVLERMDMTMSKHSHDNTI